MNNIIKFSIFTKGASMSQNNISSYTDNLESLIEKLQKNNKNLIYNKQYINDIADEILSIMAYNNIESAKPIVKIAKQFDFKVYKETLADNFSGDINVSGGTKKDYGHDKVILVNRKAELAHQRFVIAHELAHYLFEYLGNEHLYVEHRFKDKYELDHHESPEEKRANMFAAAILMPEKQFAKQYQIAYNANPKPIFVLSYLSDFFETSVDSIIKRISEVFGYNAM